MSAPQYIKYMISLSSSEKRIYRNIVKSILSRHLTLEQHDITDDIKYLKDAIPKQLFITNKVGRTITSIEEKGISKSKVEKILEVLPEVNMSVDISFLSSKPNLSDPNTKVVIEDLLGLYGLRGALKDNDLGDPLANIKCAVKEHINFMINIIGDLKVALGSLVNNSLGGNYADILTDEMLDVLEKPKGGFDNLMKLLKALGMEPGPTALDDIHLLVHEDTPIVLRSMQVSVMSNLTAYEDRMRAIKNGLSDRGSDVMELHDYLVALKRDLSIITKINNLATSWGDTNIEIVKSLTQR